MIHIVKRAAPLAAAVLAATGMAAGTGQQAQAAPSTRTCRLADLYVAIGPESGAAGSLFYPIQFTNTSMRTCALRGFPGVSVLNANHRQIGAAATRNPRPVTTVLVRPGRRVTATIRTNNSSVVPNCRRTSTYVRVFPPASTRSVAIPFRLRVCGVFQVNPVGTNG